MSQTVEFIFFQMKAEVKPEDYNNDEGTKLIQLFQATKHQSGYHSSSWGRTVEDENIVAWVIVWTDPRGAGVSPHLARFIEPSTEPTAIFSTLTPPISSSETLASNPITELCAIAFPTSLTPAERTAINQHMIDFRAALTQDLPREDRPLSWAMGHVERPGVLRHEASPSGEAFVHFLAVGWESVEKHMTIKGTKQFTETIQPIREKMLAPMEGLKMKHVAFQKI